MSYQVAFCLWLLSFEQNISEQINKSEYLRTIAINSNLAPFRQYDVIPKLIDVAQGAVKEKVIRVIVATFRVRRINGRYHELTHSSYRIW